uniref:Uncharacterized protein n=1 Tax=Lotharella globosa TaxID=91324 RepID=A0A7S4DI46_9EUKA
MFSSGESRTLVLVPYLSALRLTWRKDDSSSGSPSDEDEDDSRRHTFHRGSSDRVFEYYNRGPPYRRIPLAQHAREMQRDYPEIWNFPLDNLDPDNSWFAVSWHPVVVSGHDHVTGIFRGHFVMYHALRRNQIPWPAAKNRLKQDESRWLDTKQEGRGYVEMIGFVGFETTLDTWYTNGGGEQKKLGKAPGMLESYAAVVNHLNSKKVLINAVTFCPGADIDYPGWPSRFRPHVAIKLFVRRNGAYRFPPAAHEIRAKTSKTSCP